MGEQVYQVRQVSTDDVGRLAELRRSWAQERGFGGPEDGFDARLADWWRRQSGARMGWLAQSGGSAVGMANLAIFERMPYPGTADARWAYVGNVWVDPRHRRRGVATALMRAAIDWCRAAQMQRIVLNPSQMSIPMYASLGFRAADDLMRLDLSSPA